MKTKLILTALFAIHGALAIAGEDTVVLKDSRKYGTYMSSVSGPTGCVIPKDGEQTKPGDCSTQRSSFIVGGELLVRSASNGTCRHTIYHSRMVGLGAIKAPETSVENTTFVCTEDGQKR